MKRLKKGLLSVCLLLLVSFARASGPEATVYVFLSETCPICQSATLGLKRLYEEYHGKGIAFVGVFPNVTLSTPASVEKFAKKYGLDFPMQVDENRKWTTHFGATVTPQVFVTEGTEGEVLYRGKIDNGFERVGKRRQVTTEFYLKNALDEWLAGRPITLKTTEPVGCFIVKP